MEIYITDGRIYRVTGMGSLDEFDEYFSDIIARTNGFAHARHFIEAHTGKAYQLDRNHTIKRQVPPPRTP